MMKTTNKINALLLLLTALLIGLACGGENNGGNNGGNSQRNQKDEANKIIPAANQKSEDAKALFIKTEGRNTKLFDADIKTPQQLAAYKSKMGDEARSIIADYEKAGSMLKDVARQFGEIAKMDVGDKYQEYAKLKSDEFDKRADAVDFRKSNAQTLLDSDDPRTMAAKFDENRSKSKRLFSASEDFADKARKIEAENKDLFEKTELKEK